jgi:hypothetical protein
MNPNAPILFARWFTNAVNILRVLPNGDGGIAAFMITLPLVERAAIGKLKKAGLECSEENKKNKIGELLGLTDTHQRSIFWDMFRNGFMHLGMPLDGKTKWRFSGGYGEKPELKEIEGVKCFCLDPWKFADGVLALYQSEPDLIVGSESAPLADIFESRA